jgi:hypothetical protein
MWLQDVAVKVFSKQEYSEEIITSFKQEVLLFSVASLSMFGKRLLELVFVLSE